ncbi:MAG: DUF4883 family protein [Oscillospiraceae bacterium]|nr:DUF4883 family protein [Oscillospiraceae bacterium]
MKIKLFALLIIIVLFSSCSNKVINRFYNLKPSKYYYTSKLSRDIVYNDEIKMSSIETNYYKRFTLDSDEKGEIIRFLTLLKDDYFLTTDQILNLGDEENKKAQYKLTIDVNNNKYCIEALDENYIRVFLWDGKYVEDYIDISNFPIGENLFYYLKYIYLTKIN